jgi:hypothetical protein
MDKKTAAQIIKDYTVDGLSYRNLGKKYKMSHVRIYRMLMGKQKKQSQTKVLEIAEADLLPDDVAVLKEELRKARLKIELQDLIIDISSKELGVDLRKKRGTRQ